MAFSLALDAPGEKASRVSFSPHPQQQHLAAADQVPDETWLRLVKTASPRSDALARYGARIFSTSSGRYYVPTDEDRREIMSLRQNAGLAARVILAANDVLGYAVERAAGKKATSGALLIGDLYGPEAAIRYAKALSFAPDQLLTGAVPQMAERVGAEEPPTVAKFDTRMRQVLLAGGERMVESADGSAPRSASLVSGEVIKGTLTKFDRAEDTGGASHVAAR